MLVEIGEININLTLMAEKGQESGKENEKVLSEKTQSRLVERCVRSVLRILRDKTSRLSGLYDASLGDGLEIKGCDFTTDGKMVSWGIRLEITKGTRTSDLQFGWDFLDNLRTQYAEEGMLHSLAGSASVTHGLSLAKNLKLLKESENGWMTKSGLILLMDEKEKSVTIKSSEGQTLAINDKEGTITLKDKNKNSLVVDSSGIKLKNNKDISLETFGNIKLKATQSFKSEGLSCEVKGQKDIKLSGQAMGEISTSGILTVKGMLVKIN